MRTIPDAKLKKTSTEERGEAVWGPASRFTGHLARFTQSRHLIALQRMAAMSPNFQIAKRSKRQLRGNFETASNRDGSN
jgi:hypothetical protein